MPTDRPTATELLESVAEFIEVKVIPGLDNATAFYSRVALNVLAIVSREVEQGGSFRAEEAERLMSLLSTSADLESMNKTLAEKISLGELDYSSAEVTDHLWETTLAKLAIDNPNYSTLVKFKNREESDN
jgi:hypothetical protein